MTFPALILFSICIRNAAMRQYLTIGLMAMFGYFLGINARAQPREGAKAPPLAKSKLRKK